MTPTISAELKAQISFFRGRGRGLQSVENQVKFSNKKTSHETSQQFTYFLWFRFLINCIQRCCC